MQTLPYLGDIPQQRLLVVLAQDLQATPRLLQQSLPRFRRHSKHVALAHSLEVVALRTRKRWEVANS